MRRARFARIPSRPRFFVLAALVALAACARPEPQVAGASPSAAHVAPIAAHEPAPRGCFVLRDLDGPTRVRKGDACAERHTPASTFKVPHALLALASGARTGPDDAERWDGTAYPYAAWNQDQTLASAMRVSCVWYFRRTAARIGADRMRAGLASFHYGNGDIGSDVTRFWLDGPLAISADEQADFLERFVKRDLPADRRAIDTVDALILQRPGFIARAEPLTLDVTWDAPSALHAKTGSGEDDLGGAHQEVRWLVGHMDASGHRYVFASLVLSPGELSSEAVTQAMRELRELGLVHPKS